MPGLTSEKVGSLTVTDLRKELKKAGLDFKGNKAALVERLKGHVETAVGDEAAKEENPVEDAVVPAPAEVQIFSNYRHPTSTTTLKSLEGIVTLEASCVEHNHDQNYLLNLLRRHVAVYAGDHEFTMKAIPRSILAWPEFVKEFTKEFEECYTFDSDSDDEGLFETTCTDDEGLSETTDIKGYLDSDERRDHNLLVGKRPADVFWNITNYGDLGWSWVGMSHLHDIYTSSYDHPIEPEGTKYIREQLGADAQPDDISKMRARILSILDDIPTHIRCSKCDKVGISKMEFKKRVLQDVDMLMLIVRDYGTFGSAVVPDALSTITQAHFHYDDGNGRYACFASEKYNYSIIFETS